MLTACSSIDQSCTHHEGFKPSRDRDCTASLGSLLQCLVVLLGKHFICLVWTTEVSHCLLLLSLQTCISGKNLDLPPWKAPYSAEGFCVIPPKTFPLQVNKPQSLSLSSEGTWSSPHHPRPYLGVTTVYQCLSLTGEPRTQYNVLDVV